MEGYAMKISHLGNNIQTIRKFRGLKQQELADKIGINMQSLSKIERGLNYPAYETLEKIMEVLDVTPNELLSGEWKYVNQSEKEVCQFLRAEERLNAELKHGHYDNFFDSEEEWLEYELEKLREYITDYINGTSIEASDLYPIKEFIQHLKFQKLLDRYDDLYSMDMFGESIEGHKYRTPYQVVKMINPNSKEDMELLREVLKNNHFDDEDE
uniref:helix-turn-helix domain-containing protein n=1 Tax=Massiliimalia timonensis TaxID=1987501 RepID=UPI000B8A8E5B|nr:helix-turn-helix transcriptional regulator [Massiliimalia timonensis]